MRAIVRGCVCVLLVIVTWGISRSVSAADKVKVFVSIMPHAYFVERIGGDRLDVGVLVGPGRQPHEYEPTPKQLAELASAQVLFTAGMPFEAVLARKIQASFKNLAIADTSKGVTLRAMTEEEAETASRGKKHAHGKKDAHSHAAGAPDPHIWLDPVFAQTLAANIGETLASVDPAHADVYRKNVEAVQADLSRLDERLAAALAPLKGKAFYVYHPAFGYFADRYGLRQVPVELGGKEPSARRLAGLVTQARRLGIKVIFVQPQFSTKSAEKLAREIGGAVVPLDDLAKDYLNNMEEIATKVSAAIGQGRD